MELLRIERSDDVTVCRLNHGVTNALNPQLVDELAAYLRQVRQNRAVRSLVLTSTNDKFFSIGLDIPELLNLSREAFASFYQAFNRACMELYTLPIPTVAAITGHAIAGGCIVTLCCDHRLIAAGRKLMGLNEVKLGVPVPYLADRALRQIIGPEKATEVMEAGELYPPETLLQMGVVDEVLPLDQVLARAIARARQMMALPRDDFEGTKRRRTEPVMAKVQAHLPEKERHFVARWYSAEAQARLQEAMAKF